MASYTSLRPCGMRAVRADDLLALLRQRLGEAITEDELRDAVARIGGEPVELTSTRQLVASVFRRGKRWRTGYLVPADLFEALQLPTRFRTPRRRSGSGIDRMTRSRDGLRPLLAVLERSTPRGGNAPSV